MQTINIGFSEDSQITAEVYPKNPYWKFDIIRLKMKSIDGEEKAIDMTPDEALEVANVLTTSVMAFMHTNKEHKQWLKNIESRKHEKKLGYTYKN